MNISTALRSLDDVMGFAITGLLGVGAATGLVLLVDSAMTRDPRRRRRDLIGALICLALVAMFLWQAYQPTPFPWSDSNR